MMGMGDMSTFVNRLFRKVDNVCWDMMTGGLGIVTKEGIATCSGNGEDAEISINPFEQMSMAVPAFAQNTPVEAVKLGDLIYGFGDSKKCGWVVEIKPKSFVVLTAGGTRTTWSAPKVPVLGLGNGVMIVRSLINMLPTGATGVNQLQQSLMPMMMMMGGSDGMDFERIMPMMLMSQMGNQLQTETDAIANPLAAMGSNPMMMMAMMMSLGKNNNKNGGSRSKPSTSWFDSSNNDNDD